MNDGISSELRARKGEARGGVVAPVLRPLEVEQRYGLGTVARGLDSSLVDKVLEVGAAHAGRAASNCRAVNLGRDDHVGDVVLKDLNSPAHVRERDGDVSVEATRADEGRVERLREVGRSAREGEAIRRADEAIES